MTNRSIYDYVDPNWPQVRMTKTVKLGDRSPGFFGRDEANDRVVYVSERDADGHRYHGDDPWYDLPFEGDGYGLSLALFGRIHDTAGTVLIPEPDTGDVYEFAFSQFVDGSPINVEDDPSVDFEKDPQKVVALDDAVAVYPGHAEDMMLQQPRFR